MAFPAMAQVETVDKAQFDCTYKKKTKGVLGISRSDLAGDLISEVTDGRRKKYALRAAKQALEAGYNYAYMEPLRYEDQRFRRKYDNVWGGKSWGGEEGDEMKILGCLAFDDISAYEIMINKDIPTDAAENGGALVDLREMIIAFEGEPYKAAQKPALAAEHFEKIVGARERITQQYPVMMAALACKTTLRPTSIRDFSHAASPEDKSKQNKCLSDLRPKAQAVGMDFTALIRSDADDLGYYVNTPSQPSHSTSTTGAGQGHAADPNIWGNDWYDYSALFPNLDGKAMVDYDGKIPGESNRTYIILASNSLSKDDLIPYAVFISAKNGLTENNQKYNVANLDDRSPDSNAKHSASASIASRDNTSKAIAYATENYKTVVYVTAGNYTGCLKGKDICADKLKAYNTLGERLNVRGFTPLSTPKSYKPYTPR